MATPEQSPEDKASALRRAGFDDHQAQGIVYVLSDLATGAQVENLREELLRLRNDLTREIGGVRSDLTRDIGEVRSELARELGEIRSELARERGEMRNDLTQAVGEMRNDLAREIGGVRTEMYRELHNLWWKLAGVLFLQAGFIVSLIKLI